MTEPTIRESNGRAVGRRVQYEYESDEPPSIAVTMALAQYRGEDVTRTSTHLYDYVDPEALDALFDGSRDGDRSAHRVEFEVEGATVVVGQTGVTVSSSE
ncbi:HalOD1 output domain-containing protein [Natrarchaeobius sp. A-rgal3]|uniref:HalOD1 output domain-containing protein n=1 Tax=Natrarchaeobius versutus TaxID=1679078 RepID=UPI003510C30E